MTARGSEFRFDRIIVAGTSCAGKTSFARRLSIAMDARHIELDELHWAPEWSAKPLADFRALTEDAVRAERWVVDGNYGVVRDIVWPRAELVCWLNYSFARIFGRALKRTFRRVFQGEPCCGGNRESFRRSFLSTDSILWWIITTFRRRRQQVAALRADEQFAHLQWLEFRSPAEAEAFLAALFTRPTPAALTASRAQ